MAAPSGPFTGSHFQNYGPTSRSHHKKDKSCPGFLGKFLLVVLVLVLVPLFPSEAPDFLCSSFLSEFWELFHLLFIGIAVSYGLFCRKSVKNEVEYQPRDDACRAFSSGDLNVPALFKDGLEKLCISDDTMSVPNWDSLCTKSSKSSSEHGPSIDEDRGKLSSLMVENGVKNVHEVDEGNVGRIWNSQYFQGETLMVVADGNHILDEHNKPLGLPVRSLRSRTADDEKLEFTCRSGCNTGLKVSRGNASSKSKFGKFRVLFPRNLEKKFVEVDGPSRLSFQPRSERMDMREEIRDFELQDPFSSGTSSVFPELPNLKSENLDTVSHSTIASANDEVSYVPKARGLSIGSLRELDIPRTSKDYFNDSKISAMQDMLDREKKNSGSLHLYAKPSKLAKVLGRGKSVRTIRSRFVASDETKWNQSISAHTNNDKGGKTKDASIHSERQNSRKVHPVLKDTFPEYQNRERQIPVDSASVSEKDSESESEYEDFRESSVVEEPESKEVEDTELEGSEVDRKADEFIAKFREQMRLQKIASIKRNSCLS